MAIILYFCDRKTSDIQPMVKPTTILTKLPFSNPANRKISLQTLLIVPFVLQIFAAVGLTGYLSFRNGQKAINDLANRLIKEI
ncbi:MAG: hypothetical protein P2A85_19675 [Microcoleus anatoxicus]